MGADVGAVVIGADVGAAVGAVVIGADVGADVAGFAVGFAVGLAVGAVVIGANVGLADSKHPTVGTVQTLVFVLVLQLSIKFTCSNPPPIRKLND